MRTRTHVRVSTALGVVVLLVGSLIVAGGIDAAATGDAAPGAWIPWLLFPLGGVFFLVRARSAGVKTDERGVYVRNYWKTYFYPWSEVRRFALRPIGGLVALGVVQLRHGLERPLAGVRTWAGKDREPLIDTLNEQLSRYTQPSVPRPDRP